MKCSVLCLLVAAASAIHLKSSPDAASRVELEAQENIEIHEGFLSQEQEDDRAVEVLQAHPVSSPQKWAVALDTDMKTKMLVQLRTTVLAPAIKDPCGSISCGALKCPGGFAATTLPGHCCPYCVNPNIQVADEITGATGSHGGKASTFCKDVFCFPTLCTKAVSNPSEATGHCCSTCPAL
mmetsp:Transcript_24441/g.62450  ORF Transcript_24441/g.62450 Transcript_24441/m.62450 type:complete len:181 (+) Transcript_24441:84-626(+)